MSGVPTSCYVPTGEIGPHGGAIYASQPVSRASWYENGQHGGTVSALLVHCVEQTPTLTPMEVAWNKAYLPCVELLRELGEVDPAEKWRCACAPGQACGPSAAITLAPGMLDDEPLD